MDDRGNTEVLWLPVIGRSLAYICMQNAGIQDKTIAEKAKFLLGLGIDANVAAEMLGTSAASIKELLRQASKKSGKQGATKRASSKAKKLKSK